MEKIPEGNDAPIYAKSSLQLLRAETVHYNVIEQCDVRKRLDIAF